MTQGERWIIRYEEVMEFMENVKDGVMTVKGEMKAERLSMFKGLLTLVEENKRKNQYA